jgi:hypothetical protein
MMDEQTKAWIRQGQELLASGSKTAYDLPPFAVSMLTYFYGPSSVQVQAYLKQADNISKDKTFGGRANKLWMQARGGSIKHDS